MPATIEEHMDGREMQLSRATMGQREEPNAFNLQNLHEKENQ
jgi:hypothetical protein